MDMHVHRVNGHNNKPLNWLPKHDSYLKENYLDLSLLTMSLELGISTTAVRYRMLELGLSKKKQRPKRVFSDEPKEPWPDVPEQGEAFYEMHPGRTYSIHVQGKPPLTGKCAAVTKHLYVVKMGQYTTCFLKKDIDIRVKEYA